VSPDGQRAVSAWDVEAGSAVATSPVILPLTVARSLVRAALLLATLLDGEKLKVHYRV
jgi:hypothetical protein